MVFELSTEGSNKVRRVGNGTWDGMRWKATQYLTEPETRWLWLQHRQKREKWLEMKLVKQELLVMLMIPVLLLRAAES